MAFEVILENIPAAKARPTRAKPQLDLSAFQPVTRDFAFVVDAKVKAGDLARAAQNVDKKLITEVTVFDLYEGKGIEPGRKSIAIAVTPGCSPRISKVSLSSQLNESFSRGFSSTCDPPGALAGGGTNLASRTLTMKLTVACRPAATLNASTISRRDSALIVVSVASFGSPIVTVTR